MVRKPLIIVTLALALGGGFPAAAQAQVIEEVIVTAQKREQNMQDVGISISAFSGEQLTELGITDSTDLVAITPGLQHVQANSGVTSSFSIRGLSQSDFGASQEAPVALYVDEVYFSSQTGAQFLLFDVERAEVLRGPQGTLFGRNATGGLVHFISRKPSQETQGYADLTYGSENQIHFQGAVGGGLSESLSARASFSLNVHDELVENLTGEEDLWDADEQSGRLQLLFQPSDGTDMLLKARIARRNNTGKPWDHVSAAPTGFAGGGEFTSGQPDAFGFMEPDDDPFTVSLDDGTSFNETDFWGISGTLNQDLGGALLTSITDYHRTEAFFGEDSDIQPGELYNFHADYDTKQFSQELRLNGEAEALRWVAGVYYLNIKGDFLQRGYITDLGFGVENQDTVYTVKTDSWSLFGQVEYDLTEQLTLTGGIRYINEEKKQDYFSAFFDVVGGTKVAFGASGSPDLLTFDGKYSDDLYSAKVELGWTPQEDLLIYVSYNRGAKGGGLNAPLDPSGSSDFIDPATLDPAPTAEQTFVYGDEVLHAFEAGFKSTLADGAARLNASAFYYDYNDFQAFNLLGLTSYIQNRDAELYGFDAELFASPAEGLDLGFGVSYLSQDVWDVSLGGFTVDRKIPYAPKWNLTGLVRYEWPAFGGSMAVQGDFSYVGDHFLGLNNSQVVLEEGYALGNARLSWASADDRWGLAFFVKNIGDKLYRPVAFDLASFFGSVEQQFGYPRWYGGTLSYRFE